MTPVTSVPSRMRSTYAGQVAERRVALEHVLPLAPDLRDLEEVVHHPQAREAGLLGGARDLGERRRRARRVPGPVEARDLEPELERQRRVAPGGAAASGAPRNAGGTSATGAAARGRRRSPRRRAPRRRPAASRSWAATTFGGTGVPARAVALAHDRRRRVEHHRVGRHAVALGQRAPRRAAAWASSPVVSTTVVSPRAEPLGDDQVEQLERVAARPLVALARSRRPHAAGRGDDLVGVEPRARPRRLARRRRAHEHDEAGVRQAQRHS